MNRELKAMLLEHPEPWEPPPGILRQWAEEAVLRVKAGVYDICGTMSGRLRGQMLRLEAAEMNLRRRRAGVDLAVEGAEATGRISLAWDPEVTLIEVDLSRVEQEVFDRLQVDLAAEMGRQLEEAHVRRMVQDVLYSAGPVQAVVHRGTQAVFALVYPPCFCLDNPAERQWRQSKVRFALVPVPGDEGNSHQGLSLYAKKPPVARRL